MALALNSTALLGVLSLGSLREGGGGVESVLGSERFDLMLPDNLPNSQPATPACPFITDIYCTCCFWYGIPCHNLI
jgi:hypothetical protein